MLTSCCEKDFPSEIYGTASILGGKAWIVKIWLEIPIWTARQQVLCFTLNFYFFGYG